MLKNYTFILFFFLSIFFLFGATERDLLNENFDASLSVPPGWSVTGTSYFDWEVLDDMLDDHTTDSTNCIIFNSCATPDGETGILTTPLLSISENESEITFWFNYFFIYPGYTADAELYVDIKIDTSEVWNYGIDNLVAGQEDAGWIQYVVSLEDYIDQNINVSFRGISDWGSYGIALDDITGPSIIPPNTPPEPVTLISPDNNATEIPYYYSLNWEPSIGATGYKLYFGTEEDPPFLMDVGYVNSYSLFDIFIEYSTCYWKIVAYNEAGDSESSPIWCFESLSSPYIDQFPWIENFSTAVSGPDWPFEGWELHSGILDSFIQFGYSYEWLPGIFANNDLLNNNSVRILLALMGINDWIMPKTINLGDGSIDYELSFDLALTHPYSNTQATLSSEERFAVVISPDGGYTWTDENILREWGEGETFSNSGETFTISLADYSGLIQLGFYAESLSPSNSQLFLDNLCIRESPPYPCPENLQVEFDSNYFNLTWDLLENENLTSFNIYENNQIIGSVEDSIYSFTYEYDSGSYFAFYITALYGDIESAPSDTFFLEIVNNNEISQIEKPTTLRTAYPNPFKYNNTRNNEITIKFDLGHESNVKLDIFNIKGQKVVSLVNEKMLAGEKTVTWNAKNSEGIKIHSGIYFYQLKTDKKELTKKIVILQ